MTNEAKRALDHARVVERQKRLANPLMLTRFCRTCETTKPREEFYPSCETCCRSCAQKKAAPTRSRRLQYLAKWRLEHPGAFAEWTADHRTERAQYGAEWRAKNHQQHRDNYKRWAKRNHSKIAALVMKRYASKLNATPEWADRETIENFYAEAIRLTQETGVRHEVDHIVPLQSPLVCGLHVEWNLQILTSFENKRKRNHFSRDGMQDLSVSIDPALDRLRPD